MSGGSYNYAFLKIDDLANEIRTNNDPKRIAFVDLLKKVSDAAHAIEWEDSGDTGKEGTDKAINTVFKSLIGDPNLLYRVKAFNEFKKIIDKLEE